MKKLLLGALLLVQVCQLQAYETYDDGQLSYEIVSSHAVVKGLSAANKTAETVVIPQQIKKNGNVYEVTSVSCRAFQGNTSLKTVEMNSISTVGENAFLECASLTKVLAANVKTLSENCFSNCLNLKEGDFSNLETIGNGAFRQCENLTESVFKSNTITSIGEYAFYSCKNIKDFDLLLNGSPVSKIGYYAFRGTGISEVTLPAVTSLSSAAFSNLKRMTIDGSLLQTSQNLFVDFLAVDGVLEVGSNSGAATDLKLKFRPATGEAHIKALVIADNIRAIDGGCFLNIVADSVYVGKLADFNCAPHQIQIRCLGTLKINSPALCAENGVKKFTQSSNLHNAFGYEMWTIDASDIELADAVCSNNAFYTAVPSSLTVLKCGWKTVGDNAFSGNGNLNDVSFGNAQTIGNSAFANCGITSFLANDAVKVGNYAFKGNPLVTVELNNTASDVSATAFEGTQPRVVVDLTDKLLFAANKAHVKLVTNTEERAKWLRQNGYTYAASLKRMKYDIEDVDMSGGLSGDDAQRVYNAMK